MISQRTTRLRDLDSHDDTRSVREILVVFFVQEIGFEELELKTELVCSLRADEVNENLSVSDQRIDDKLLAIDPRMLSGDFADPSSRPVFPFGFDCCIPDLIERPLVLVSGRDVSSSDLEGETFLSANLSPVNLESSCSIRIVSTELTGSIPESLQCSSDLPICRGCSSVKVCEQSSCLSRLIIPPRKSRLRSSFRLRFIP